MDILSIAMILFIILESLNVIILYKFPNSTKGNGVGVFTAYEKSKDDPEIHAFIKYLINWIAGTKLIFILLLVVVILTGTIVTKIFSLVALIFSISTFFWKLYPIIKKMDEEGQISPKGYSKTLGRMIAAFIGIFVIVLVAFLFKYFQIL
jgi:hypothetical protein